MIEKTIFDYLTAELDCPVYMEKPELPPVRYVIIEKTGGSCADFLYNATIALQSYAGSLYEAAALNEAVITAMQNMIRLDSVSKSKLNSNYNYTDTSKKAYRYQAVFDVFYLI